MGKNFKWTDAAKELLHKCVTDRLTARQAAAVISERFDHRVSRESALKKALSLGWGFDGDSPNNGKRNMPQFANGVARVPKAPVAPRVPKVKAPKAAKPRSISALPPRKPALAPIAPALAEIVEPAEVVVPISQRVTLDDLRNGTCRWPIARDDDQWMFCGGHGANFAAGRPYCAGHARASRGTGTPSERRAVKDGARAAERAA